MRVLLYLAIIVLVLSCKNQEQKYMDNYKTVYNVKGNIEIRDVLLKLSSRKIIFGHQSVGKNILSGLNQLEAETGIKLNIIESRDFSRIKEPSLIHFRVGVNRDAVSKINDFKSIIEDVSKDSGSIAFFKFCYVDIREDDDIDSIFKYYKENMLYLKEKHPGTRLILFTVPLKALQKGPKALVKKMLMMPVGGVMDNIKRARFNEMMLEELQDEFPIFDIAKVESTLPDGTPFAFKRKGKQYPCMPGIYTYDGGHLNKLGEKVVAHNLVNFLYNQSN